MQNERHPIHVFVLCYAQIVELSLEYVIIKIKDEGNRNKCHNSYPVFRFFTNTITILVISVMHLPIHAHENGTSRSSRTIERTNGTQNNK